MYRQGDVLLRKLSADLPSDLKVRDSGIVQYGEATGHAHRFTDGSVEILEGSDGQVYVRITAESADLTHEEHAPISIPRGDYEVVIQREYDPEGYIRVMD